MAVLYITEYDELVKDVNGNPILVGKEPGVTQTVTFTSSAQSAAFASSTRFVRIQADTGCFVLFGSNPTATTSHMPLTADTPEYFGVIAGDKVAAYDGVT